MKPLSKSKLLSFRQCPRRLWLELHQPDLLETTPEAEAHFAAGHQVGEVARSLYAPRGGGILIGRDQGGADALKRTQEALREGQPIFEAGFSAGGALCYADVLLPVRQQRKLAWRLVEVKSATSAKPYHAEDIAIQAAVIQGAGLPLAGVSLARVDSQWTYPGGGDYRGLLKEEDMRAAIAPLTGEVPGWIKAAHAIAARRAEPKVSTGPQCSKPHDCGFYDYCASQEPQVKHPAAWLPRAQAKGLKAFLEKNPRASLKQVPDKLLNEMQQRVKRHTLSGKPYFDAKGAAAALAKHKAPAYFMDFESINMAVPIWKGTRPYQHVCYQFSVRKLGRNGKQQVLGFLDLSGQDPSKAFAEALLKACGERGPIFVYNQTFEKARIKELAARLPRLRSGLNALIGRLVDLLPIAQQHYYHPSQQGSWSIKQVLPSIAPDLRYEALSGVQHGEQASAAYLEAIHPQTSAARKRELHQQLTDYCNLDTEALVRLWRKFTDHIQERSK